MEEKDFRDTLPSIAFCDKCGASIRQIAWQVARYGQSQWFAIGIAKCEPCSWVRVAAAGSDDLSHSYARSTRQKFVSLMDLA